MFKMYGWKVKEAAIEEDLQLILNELNQEGYEIYQISKTGEDTRHWYFVVIARKPIELTVKD